MDERKMDPAIGQTTERITGADPVRRNADLAAARQRQSAEALDSASLAEDSRAEQRDAARSVLEQAIGANTRLSIARSDSADTFIYRAIDRDTGEVIQEWPPAQFARLLEEQGARGVSEEIIAGLVVDEEA